MGSVRHSELEQRLWEILQGERRGGILAANLRTFLGAVMKIRLLPIGEAPFDAGDTYGDFGADGVYHIGAEQAARIHREFGEWYVNRSALGQRDTTHSKEGPAEYSFSPRLCEQSLKMAMTARGSTASAAAGYKNPEERSVAHVQQLIQLKEQQDK